MLTEQQIADLRPKWNDYPERRVVVPVYPPARKKRGLSKEQQAAFEDTEPSALPAGGLTGAPTVRLWSVSLFSNGVGVFISRSSPRFVGPALIHSASGMIRTANVGGTIFPVQIAYNSSQFDNTDAGVGSTRLPGTHIVMAADPFHNAATAIPIGDGIVNDMTSGTGTYAIGVYVPDKEFFLGVGIQGTAAGLAYCQLLFRIIENAPPESIGWV